jgi:hypothetical protein
MYRMERQCVSDRRRKQGLHPVRCFYYRLIQWLILTILPSYVDEATARSGGLINVNSAGNAIVKVDNTTSDPAPGPFSTFGRNTVLLISKDTINIGSLVVMDAVHIPFGVSPYSRCLR